MNSDYFQSYLKHYLDKCFFDYPSDIASSMWEFLEGVIPIIESDMKAKLWRLNNSDCTFENISKLMISDITLEIVLFYRLQRNIFLLDPQNPLLPYLASLMRIRFGAEFYYSTEIGPGLSVHHGTGIVIGPRSKIGKNFLICQNVTLGQKNLYAPNETLVIGDDVVAFAGAKVLGNLTIGNNVWISANAVVLKDCVPNSVYGGVPARKIGELGQVKETPEGARLATVV